MRDRKRGRDKMEKGLSKKFSNRIANSPFADPTVTDILNIKKMVRKKRVRNHNAVPKRFAYKRKDKS